MGRRNDIDWEAIERDFRAGQLSVREIGAKHGVAPSSITRRADKDEAAGRPWTRDLTGAVQARTKEKLVQPAESAQSNAANATQRAHHRALQAEQAIEEAAETNVQVILAHRGTITKARGITASLLDELEAGALASPKAKKKAPLEKRATMLKSLSEAMRIQIGLERQAFNIADGGQDLADPLNSLLSDLMKRRSALPIVEDVE
jgi:hypothetical protein